MTALANIDPDRIVWQPVPQSSQELAVSTISDHTLFCGTRGGGKTATQLMWFRKFVGKGYGAFLRGVIFDREFKHLSDLVAQSKRFFKDFDDGCKFLESGSDYKWVWATGEELLFRHVKKLSDYDSYHGHEYPMIGWNELTKYPTADLYDKMMSTNRSSFVPEKHTPKIKCNPKTPNAIKNKHTGQWEVYNTHDGLPLPPIPLQVFSTCNPSGAGNNWVKRRFITPAPYGVQVVRETEVFDPKTRKDVIVRKTQMAIFSTYRENIYLDPKYIAELDRLTENDENLRKAWLEGSWDITAGGAIDDLWNRNVHILPRFPIPEAWYIDRSFDWGSSHPFSVGWWAEANGEEVIVPYAGVNYVFCPPAGTLIQFAEWYGARDTFSNVGLKMSATDIAKGIKEKEIGMLATGWIKTQPVGGCADNQISDVRENDVDTIALKMQKEGISWTRSDKSAGSRVIGLQLFRDRLAAALRKERPAIYFMQNCIGSIETLPNLPRDEIKIDDVDTSSIDHAYDMVRYRVLKGNNRLATNVDVKFTN